MVIIFLIIGGYHKCTTINNLDFACGLPLAEVQQTVMPLNNTVCKRVHFLPSLKMPEFHWHGAQVQNKAANTDSNVWSKPPKASKLIANMLAHLGMNPLTHFHFLVILKP